VQIQLKGIKNEIEKPNTCKARLVRRILERRRNECLNPEQTNLC
jgi:hypothetical protein